MPARGLVYLGFVSPLRHVHPAQPTTTAAAASGFRIPPPADLGVQIGSYVRTAASLLSLPEALLACVAWAFVSTVPPKKTSNC